MQSTESAIVAYSTPRQLAQRYGVAVDKVLGWIHAGELRALNVATANSGRPRFRISPEAVALFEASRSPHGKIAVPAQPKRKLPPKRPGWKKFF